MHHSTFRKNGASLDEIFNKYCKKGKQLKNDHSVDIQYVCDVSTTGMRSAHFDSREYGNGENYLMTLDIDFEYKSYESVKRLITAKLGVAQRKKKNYTGWEFKSDKFLNERGNPVIDVSRDKDDNSSTFSVVLEQGESDH